MKPAKIFTYILLAVSMVLCAWGILGLLEFLTGIAWVAPLQNPNFPQGTQLVHWVLIVAAGVTFVAGYWAKWKRMPFAMTVIYGMMAVLCTIETFDFMTEEWRYHAYAVEMTAYVLISVFLLRSSFIKSHLG